MEPVAFCDWFGSLEIANCDLKDAFSSAVSREVIGDWREEGPRGAPEGSRLHRGYGVPRRADVRLRSLSVNGCRLIGETQERTIFI